MTGWWTPEALEESPWRAQSPAQSPWSQWDTLDLSPTFTIDSSQNHRYGVEDAETALARAREDQQAWESASQQRSRIGSRRARSSAPSTFGPRQRHLQESREFDAARLAEERRAHDRAIEDAETGLARAREQPAGGGGLVLPRVQPSDTAGFVAGLFSSLGLELPLGIGG